MRWNLHGLTIAGETYDAALQAHWQRSFASAPGGAHVGGPDVRFELSLVPNVPAPPSGAPDFQQDDLLRYYLEGRTAVAHFPRFGQLRLDLENGTTEGRIVPATLTTYGVFEDLVAIGLSPHLRRRGMFLIHAFAAACSPHRHASGSSDQREGGATLLVGGIGSGKTTTGLSLLEAGWRLLSNDSPLINAAADVLSYPGLLAAYPDTLARFEATASLSATASPAEKGRAKIAIAAESIWPEIWIYRVQAGAIFSPHIEARADHRLEPISPPDALRRLLPHAVEQWDRDMIPEHLRVLRRLVEFAPAFVLRLGPHLPSIPPLLLEAVRRPLSSE